MNLKSSPPDVDCVMGGFVMRSFFGNKSGRNRPCISRRFLPERFMLFQGFCQENQSPTTVMLQVAVIPVSLASRAVMVAVPALVPVTSPSITDTTEELLVRHTISSAS